MGKGVDPQVTLMILVILFGSIALHEYGHAKSADAAGDPTPRMQGRVTLNPLAHFDPLGAVMIVMLALTGFGIGWGKPVMINPSRMQNPRWDSFMSVLWGPLTNLLLAILFALLFRFVGPAGGESFLLYCLLAVLINLALCLFNLIPLGPLDGHWLVGYLLPQPLGSRFILWCRRQGTMILLGIILIDQFVLRPSHRETIIGMIILEPRDRLAALLLGI